MDTKICTKCNNSLPISDFRNRIKKVEDKQYNYLSSWCRNCDKLDREKNRTKEYRDTYKNRKKLENPIKFHIQERISQWKRKDPESDLTVNFLLDMYNAQNGLCFYTKKPLLINGNDLQNAISLDKVNPLLGYKQGNVVWCLYRINTIKGNLNLNEFKQMISTILNNI